MDAAGATAFFENLDLSTLPLLSELDLNGNPLSSGGVEALAAALTQGKLPTLKILHLAGVKSISHQDRALLSSAVAKSGRTLQLI